MSDPAQWQAVAIPDDPEGSIWGSPCATEALAVSDALTSYLDEAPEPGEPPDEIVVYRDPVWEWGTNDGDAEIVSYGERVVWTRAVTP